MLVSYEIILKNVLDKLIFEFLLESNGFVFREINTADNKDGLIETELRQKEEQKENAV